MERRASRRRDFATSETGAAAIEYCLIAGITVVAIVASLTSIGDRLLTLFAEVSSAFGA